ncbi:hypothetical protein QOZ96_002289 [Brevundimonas nasdae]|uniref:DUF2840 domain-containing protein n=1 Tax=Brevundimonas nasdae TaxID=172043 RepID=UPI001912D1AF|nr:DUF2840 domain-containing protein [Brevundimonas nasdae]MBK6025811.1 DUF2840 domain-containing protein [Brevundimonas nasdae]MDQ0452336.1 hypothetical protein [Brevundimonas nasdae]
MSGPPRKSDGSDPVRAPRPAPPLALVAETACVARDALTWVELIDDEGRAERWIRFGAVAETHRVSAHNQFVGFAPGAVFAYVRWACGPRGAVGARLDILQAVERGAARVAIPGVTPGAVSLLRLNGWSRVRHALAVIDAVAETGVALEAVAPDHWRHVHNRMTAGLLPQAYSTARHRALKLRQALAGDGRS